MPTDVYGDFEWDSEKAAESFAKHGVSFGEAAVAMVDPLCIDFENVSHPNRLITLATGFADRILYVVSTKHGEYIRIISARRATSHERRISEQGDRD